MQRNVGLRYIWKSLKKSKKLEKDIFYYINDLQQKEDLKAFL